jgi:hypothetical protein
MAEDFGRRRRHGTAAGRRRPAARRVGIMGQYRTADEQKPRPPSVDRARGAAFSLRGGGPAQARVYSARQPTLTVFGLSK